MKHVCHTAMLVGRDSHSAVLIDFGRGQRTSDGGDEHDNQALRRAKAQDLFDYGYLIKDLAQQWMASASQVTVPPILLDVLSKSSHQDTVMRDIVDIWQTWFIMKEAVEIVGALEREFVQGDSAWKSIEKHGL